MFDKSSDTLHSKTLELIKSKHEWLLNGKEYAELPVYIRKAIEEQRNNSERVISWIQIAILIVFTVLYITADIRKNTGFRLQVPFANPLSIASFYDHQLPGVNTPSMNSASTRV